jgi:hypothetical protein
VYYIVFDQLHILNLVHYYHLDLLHLQLHNLFHLDRKENFSIKKHSLSFIYLEQYQTQLSLHHQHYVSIFEDYS